MDGFSVKGSDQGILVRTKTSGDSLGELALMYDAKRNFTARATTHGLLWGVNRAEFKSILTRHFSGSLLAQVWENSRFPFHNPEYCSHA